VSSLIDLQECAVPRPKDQRERRQQLIAAAERVVLARGAANVRLRDVAEEAGLTSGAVLYYYDELDALLAETRQRAVDRFCRQREDAVHALDDPREQLRAAIACGLPSGPDDELVRLLYELDGQAIRDHRYGAASRAYFDRQVAIYHPVLLAGQERGLFHLAAPVRDIARNLVALEDGYGYYVVVPGTAFDRETAEALVISYAETATQCALS
jgi:DNA-binding transcriptional regulator YbjK